MHARHARVATLLATLLLAACEAPPPTAETPDAGQPPSSECEFGPHADSISLSEGSRAFLEFTPTEGGTIQLRDVPVGWLRKALGENRFMLKPPLGSAGTHRVSFELTCGEESRTTELAVEVRPLRWSAAVAWTPKQNGPTAREHPALWFDEQNPDHLYLFGGYLFEPSQYTVGWDLWRLDLATGTWSELQANGAAPQRAGGRVAQIPGERAILFYGGDRQDQTAPDALDRFDLATSTWTPVPLSPSQPSGEILHSLVFDAPRSRFVSACGIRGRDAIHCDVHALSLANGGAERTRLQPVLASPGPGPAGRYGFAYAYDAETERLIVVSGARMPVRQDDMVNPAPDTWALELGGEAPAWQKLAEHPEGAGRNGCWALDPVGHRLFVWGGTPDARSDVPGLRVLDLERGRESWTTLQRPGSPGARSSCSAIYDAKRHRILFGFGNNLTAIYADLHALEL